MRRQNRWRLAGIVAILILAAVFLVRLPINPGLDLAGGVHVILEVEPGYETNEDVMNRVKLVISRRVDNLGVAEPVIQLKGERQIIVDLPGIEDQQQAIETIGKTAVLEFKDPDGNTILTGANLVAANLSTDQWGRPAVSFKLDKEGAKKFAEMTRKNIGRQAPILLDDEVISNPVIQSAIENGEGQITGNFTADEAKHLVTLLRAGSLPVPLQVVETRRVGPTLGQESIDQSISTMVVGVILVLLYMIFYYRSPGFLADVALAIYLVLLMAALAALHATVTLPGVAGLILSVGMAVDANIIIFERIKEERRKGKHVRAAVDAGFSRAFTSILDANVTTLITAAVLFFFGTGPIKGFAVTLSLGILLSMFTAIFVTRTFLTMLVDWNPKRFANSFGKVGGAE
ncbi:MAG: protein translocase subunit SecD [Firmicutes bacterium]|nr:protein translocase subunit SecD [Bacillota bacterium]